MFNQDAAAVLASIGNGMLENARENVFQWKNKDNLGKTSLLAEIYHCQYVLIFDRTDDGVHYRPIFMDRRVHL